MLDCIVVGAGPAGIAAGRMLKRSGARIKILEAAERVGGRTKSDFRHGFIYDLGAAFITSFYDLTIRLARSSKVRLIAPKLHPGRTGKVHSLLINGNLSPYNLASLKGFHRFPHVPPLQKLRTLLTVAQLAAEHRLHISDIGSLAAQDDEDAVSWGQRVLGSQACEYFVRLAFEPFFFYRSEEASAAFVRALLRHSVGWRLFAPEHGMGTLCERLADDLPVATGLQVLEIAEDGEGLAVIHTGGVDYARTVIAAIPAPAAMRVKMPLSDEDSMTLATVKFIPCVRVHLGYNRRPVLDHPAITPAGSGKHPIAGISELSRWIPSRAPQGREIVRVSAGAWRSEQLINRPSKQVIDALLFDCRSLGVIIPEPDWAEVLVEPEAIVKTPPGHFRKMRSFLRRDHGRIFFAGDWLSGSTIEGAVCTGIASAEAVTRFRGI